MIRYENLVFVNIHDRVFDVALDTDSPSDDHGREDPRPRMTQQGRTSRVQDLASEPKEATKTHRTHNAHVLLTG